MRPKKTKAEWYKHDCKPGKTIRILESLYGNDGFAFWFRLLQILGDTDNHAFYASEKMNWVDLVSQMHMPEERAEKILQTLCDLEAIDRELWISSRVIWVQKFVDRLDDLYEKRKSEIPTRPSPKTPHTTKPEVSAPETRVSDPETMISAAETPQSIGEESIEEKNNTTPPAVGGRGDDHASKAKEYPKSIHALCLRLRDSILAEDPKFKVKRWPLWLQEMDRLVRIDSRPESEVEQVINFARGDPFWRTVILSASNLRDKYPRLLARMKTTKGGSRGSNGTHRKFENSRPSSEFDDVETIKFVPGSPVLKMPDGDG